MHRLTIKRSKWLHRTLDQYIHDGTTNSKLLNEEGLRCCMGFDAHNVCKVSDAKLRNKCYPDEVGLNHLEIYIDKFFYIFERTSLTPPFYRTCNILSDLVGRVNDRTGSGIFAWLNTVSDEEQENIIKRLYSLVNYKVTFVD